MKKIFALIAFTTLLITGCVPPPEPEIPEDTPLAEISVSPESIATTLDGGRYEFTVISNASWVVSCDQPDVAIDPDTSSS